MANSRSDRFVLGRSRAVIPQYSLPYQCLRLGSGKSVTVGRHCRCKAPRLCPSSDAFGDEIQRRQQPVKAMKADSTSPCSIARGVLPPAGSPAPALMRLSRCFCSRGIVAPVPTVRPGKEKMGGMPATQHVCFSADRQLLPQTGTGLTADSACPSRFSEHQRFGDQLLKGPGGNASLCRRKRLLRGTSVNRRRDGAWQAAVVQPRRKQPVAQTSAYAWSDGEG